MEPTKQEHSTFEEKKKTFERLINTFGALFRTLNSTGFSLPPSSSGVPVVSSPAVIAKLQADSNSVLRCATGLWSGTVPLSIGTVLSTCLLWVWQRWIIQRLLL